MNYFVFCSPAKTREQAVLLAVGAWLFAETCVSAGGEWERILMLCGWWGCLSP